MRRVKQQVKVLMSTLAERMRILKSMGTWGKEEAEAVKRRHDVLKIVAMEDSIAKETKLLAVISDVTAGIRSVKERKAKASGRRTSERGAAPARRKPRAAATGGRGPKAEWIPRKTKRNPDSQSAHIRDGQKHEDDYRKLKAQWEKAFSGGKMSLKKVMRGYDHLWLARMHYNLGGDSQGADEVNEDRVELRGMITDTFDECAEELGDTRKKMVAQAKVKTVYAAGAKSNPTKAQHKAIGQKFLKKSEKAWDKYCKGGCKLNDLLDAYEDLSIAYEELKHAGDRKGMAQAKEGLKAARAEIASLTK